VGGIVIDGLPLHARDHLPDGPDPIDFPTAEAGEVAVYSAFARAFVPGDAVASDTWTDFTNPPAFSDFSADADAISLFSESGTGLGIDIGPISGVLDTGGWLVTVEAEWAVSSGDNPDPGFWLGLAIELRTTDRRWYFPADILLTEGLGASDEQLMAQSLYFTGGAGAGALGVRVKVWHNWSSALSFDEGSIQLCKVHAIS